MPSQLVLNPGHHHGDQIAEFVVSEFPPLWNVMPLGNAAATTGRGRMLSDEDRVTAHRGLLAVVSWLGRTDPPSEQFVSMLLDRVLALCAGIVDVLAGEVKLRTYL